MCRSTATALSCTRASASSPPNRRKRPTKGQNGGNTRVVKVEIGQFINQTEKDIDELVEIIDEKLEERREREERV